MIALSLSDIQLIQKIAQEAGQAIMQVYEQPTANWQLEQKADDSPLTLADQRSNAIICQALACHWPEIPIISEEEEIAPYEERKNYRYCWLIDPLDGTREFVNRNGEFAINIALVERGEVIFGLLYAPLTQSLYWAQKGAGAFVVEEGKNKRIWANTFSFEQEGLRVLGSRSHLRPATAAYIQSLNQPQFMAKGSALKFMALAQGQADIYPRLGPTMEWDTAAPQIILEEAGGQILDWESRKPLRYNKADLHNPHFMAQGKEEQ